MKKAEKTNCNCDRKLECSKALMMDPENCYICNVTSVFYSRNLFKTKSKYSETRICEFIRRLLGNYPSEREFGSISRSENEHCVCIECLNKIDEYDLACMTAKRAEQELRDILLHTETLLFQETKTFNADEGFGPPFESIDTVDEYKVENSDENEEIESMEQKSESENYQVQSDSDDDYIPPGSNKRRLDKRKKSQTTHLKSRTKTDNIGHKCHKCNMEFKSVAALARHMPIKTESNNGHEQTIVNYSCAICSEAFCTKLQLEHHQRQHKEVEEQFKCTICGFDLKEKVSLDEHIQLHTGLLPLQCVTCKKTFKQKGALVRHMRIHSGLNFYQCHRCGKGFIHKSSFEMHLLAHDDIRKKKCPHCDQMFRSTSHLNRHLRIHTGSKPFSCPICGQKFAQRYNMSVHQRLHDTSSNRLKSDKTHICKFCNSAFARQSKLEEHLKKNHEAIIPHTSIGNNLDDTNEI